ncbi:MAG: hypothetical protein RSB41_02645 [Bacilli bacterium]
MSYPIITSSLISREDAVGDMIESIAYQETSISHILNAESEKIEQVLKTGTYEEILKVNKSVSRTIKSLNYLERILINKLKLFSSIICNIT